MRKSPESRMLTYNFFTNIYSAIEQEMLNEQFSNSIACSNPYIEELLKKLIVNKNQETVKYCLLLHIIVDVVEL